MTMRQAAGAMAALLAVAAAQGGPISWSYSSTLVPVGGAPWYPGVMTTLQNIHGQYVSRLSGGTGGPHFGWQTVRAGTISPTDGGGDPLADIADSYRLTVRLTDAASGQSGDVTYTGSAAEDAVWAGDPPFQQPINRHAYPFGLRAEGNERLTLGGHEYRLAVVPVRGADGNGYLDAAVQVGDVQATPEPGTLVLCGVGLAAAVGAWVRRTRR